MMVGILSHKHISDLVDVKRKLRRNACPMQLCFSSLLLYKCDLVGAVLRAITVT